jgi:transcription-repair coupling factor (superfamily II helicase)
MEALGFDLYTQMLERTVAELRGEDVEDETSVTLNLGVDVAIPDDYISDMGQRLRTYKRVSSARDDVTLTSIRDETADRYGRIPASVDRLFDYARLRRLAEEMAVLSIDKTPDGAAIKFSEKARISPEKLGNFVSHHEGSIFTPAGVLKLVLSEDEQDEILRVVRDVLLQLRASD